MTEWDKAYIQGRRHTDAEPEHEDTTDDTTEGADWAWFLATAAVACVAVVYAVVWVLETAL